MSSSPPKFSMKNGYVVLRSAHKIQTLDNSSPSRARVILNTDKLNMKDVFQSLERLGTSANLDIDFNNKFQLINLHREKRPYRPTTATSSIKPPFHSELPSHVTSHRNTIFLTRARLSYGSNTEPAEELSKSHKSIRPLKTEFVEEEPNFYLSGGTTPRTLHDAPSLDKFPPFDTSQSKRNSILSQTYYSLLTSKSTTLLPIKSMVASPKAQRKDSVKPKKEIKSLKGIITKSFKQNFKEAFEEKGNSLNKVQSKHTPSKPISSLRKNEKLLTSGRSKYFKIPASEYASHTLTELLNIKVK